jgi:hypothetical protein
MPTSLPAGFLRVESLAVIVAAVALYFDADYSAWAFFAFLLAPDLSFAGYLGGPRVGAVVYNLAHTYAWPVALAAACCSPGKRGSPCRSHSSGRPTSASTASSASASSTRPPSRTRI